VKPVDEDGLASKVVKKMKGKNGIAVNTTGLATLSEQKSIQNQLTKLQQSVDTFHTSPVMGNGKGSGKGRGRGGRSRDDVQGQDSDHEPGISKRQKTDDLKVLKMFDNAHKENAQRQERQFDTLAKAMVTVHGQTTGQKSKPDALEAALEKAGFTRADILCFKTLGELENDITDLDKQHQRPLKAYFRRYQNTKKSGESSAEDEA
jgi:hypothetical protein